jgi:hypothetical protein
MPAVVGQAVQLGNQVLTGNAALDQTRKRHSTEQIVRKLTAADRLLADA